MNEDINLNTTSPVNLSPLILLRENWPAFEKLFLSVADQPGFAAFLSAYRGHSADNQGVDNTALRDVFLSELKSLLKSCFTDDLTTTWFLENDKIDAFEATLNSALYYWHGLNDRNFQFRTIVHFLGLSSEYFSIQNTDFELNVCLSEWGVSFSNDNSFAAFPRRASLARVCGLTNLRVTLPLSHQDSVSLFAKIRLLQREFCLLIDEWEHCNSILAVQQFSLRKALQNDSEFANKAMSQIFQTRNGLAHWCVQSTADFQKFSVRAREIPTLSSDVVSELNALDALILSGFQKFLLPGAVSRHVYSENVIREFVRWSQERLNSYPDDVFANIAEISFLTALKERSDIFKVTNLISGRSFDWILSADPSAAVKSVCWGLSSLEHRFLIALLIVILDAKLAPQALDCFWLQAIASVVEIRGTFPARQKEASTISLRTAVFEKLNHDALGILRKCMSSSRDEALKAAEFLNEFLHSEIDFEGLSSEL